VSLPLLSTPLAGEAPGILNTATDLRSGLQRKLRGNHTIMKKDSIPLDVEALPISFRPILPKLSIPLTSLRTTSPQAVEEQGISVLALALVNLAAGT